MLTIDYWILILELTVQQYSYVLIVSEGSLLEFTIKTIMLIREISLHALERKASINKQIAEII